MATRMTDTDRTTGTATSRPRVWPWVLLAALVALALWWGASANRTGTDTGYNSSTPYGMSPGTGTSGTAPSGLGTPGTGDMGGVGTPSPAPMTPGAGGAGQ